MIRPFKLVMVTSAMAGEGKSTIAANTAAFLAMSGKHVLLVDADLRHPALDKHFQLSNQTGLSNAFLEKWTQIEADLDGRATDIPSLRVLTAGTLPSNPSELLRVTVGQSDLQSLSEHINIRLCYLRFSTTTANCRCANNGYIYASDYFIVDTSKTPRKAMLRAKRTLNRTGTRILGVVLNKSNWREYGEVHDYLSNIQSRPRADLSMVMPPNTPPINHSIDAANTAVLPSTNNKH